MIEKIPDNIDLSQDFLATYWSGKLGVSQGRLQQAISMVGNDSKRVEKFLNDGYRLAIRDEVGIGHQVVRITQQEDGFAALVPYHPAKNGWIYELPPDYSKTKFITPFKSGKHYTVSDVAKLSFHMSGFVQFSSGGGKPIVSGYNQELKLVKGAGLHAPNRVQVTTGPLFGVQVYGLEHFEKCTSKPVEMFEPGDLWYRVGEATANDIAWNIEVFMFPKKALSGACVIGNKYMLRRKLPYNSSIWFEHDLRVLEFPQLPFFLGVIVSRIPGDSTLASGYKIMGPGCGPDEIKKCIAAQYPCPDMVSEFNPTSLDYVPPKEADSDE